MWLRTAFAAALGLLIASGPHGARAASADILPVRVFEAAAAPARRTGGEFGIRP